MDIDITTSDEKLVRQLENLLQKEIGEYDIVGPNKKTIEYKSALPGNTSRERKEFLADVSSFANAAGGHIIYGIVEEKGIPKKLDGVDIQNKDEEIGKRENQIRDGIQPRTKAEHRIVDIGGSKQVYIIHAPKSWNGPHRVSLEGHNKFYTRSANGKYEMDVPELRSAFLVSETIVESAKRFRVDRLSKIIAGETPFPLRDGAKTVLHMIPFNSFSPAQIHDITKITMSDLRQICVGSISGDRYNFDGYATFSSFGENKAYSYAQLFKNGIIEAVDTFLLDNDNTIPSVTFEEKLLKAIPMYFSTFKKIDVETPIFIFISLVGVKGFSMSVDRSKFWIDNVEVIDRDMLFTENIIEDKNFDTEKILKPCFDSVWNACGYPHSMHYDQNGKWVGAD